MCAAVVGEVVRYRRMALFELTTTQSKDWWRLLLGFTELRRTGFQSATTPKRTEEFQALRCVKLDAC